MYNLCFTIQTNSFFFFEINDDIFFALDTAFTVIMGIIIFLRGKESIRLLMAHSSVLDIILLFLQHTINSIMLTFFFFLLLLNKKLCEIKIKFLILLITLRFFWAYFINMLFFTHKIKEDTNSIDLHF